jgi:hypothetical protein
MLELPRQLLVVLVEQLPIQVEPRHFLDILGVVVPVHHPLQEAALLEIPIQTDMVLVEPHKLLVDMVVLELVAVEVDIYQQLVLLVERQDHLNGQLLSHRKVEVLLVEQAVLQLVQMPTLQMM